MVKSINIEKVGIKFILAVIFGLLLFQSILPFIVANDLNGSPLEISTPQKVYNLPIGNNTTITWNFTVPNHEYAVYWEIIGNGVNKNGWGIKANCTTPTITDYDTEWNYTCHGYWAKYHVSSTVKVRGPQTGVEGIYGQKISSNGYIGWTTNGKAINTAGVDQKNPQIISDGAGNAIITWEDSDIFSQKINSNGATQWAAINVGICKESDVQENPQIVSDGANGAIIAWADKRSGNFDIYAQRINSSGDTQWVTNGAAICTENGTQKSPQLVSDGVNGSIITWQDGRNGNFDIYAQRINSSGDIQWDANGTAICIENFNQISPQIVSDGAEGAIITWQDERSGNFNIYAQKINSSGDVQWSANGIAICTEGQVQKFPQLVSDGAEGAIITWQDERSGNFDIYAQKINFSGDTQWVTNGAAICTKNGDQKCPQLVSDGAQGAIITWQDDRERNGNFDIYAQKINSNGDIQWSANGTAISNGFSDKKLPQLVSVGPGGAIITWQDNRSGDLNIYAQKINSNGIIQWSMVDEAICRANGDQKSPQLVSDGAGGAIIAWEDNRFIVDDGEEEEEEDGDGDGDGTNGVYDTTVPGFPPFLFIIISSICVIIMILKFHISLKNKNSK